MANDPIQSATPAHIFLPKNHIQLMLIKSKINVPNKKAVWPRHHRFK